MSGIRFVSTGELEGITARQGNHLCDYPQGMPICTQNAGGLTFFRRTVFRKRRTEALFEAQYLHFIFGPNQNTPCSQGVFWFGHCTNWGIGRPARLLARPPGPEPQDLSLLPERRLVALGLDAIKLLKLRVGRVGPVARLLSGGDGGVVAKDHLHG